MELVVDHSTHELGHVFHFDPEVGRSRFTASWSDLNTLVAEFATSLLTRAPFAGLVPVLDEDGYLDWDDPPQT